MRKLSHAIIALIIAVLSPAVSAQDTQTKVAAREAEWNNHVLPKEEFARHVDPSGAVVFRVPVSWKAEVEMGKEGSQKVRYLGPQSSVMRIVTEKISDGLPLQDYSAAIVRQLRSLPGSDTLLVRNTELSGLPAREISFLMPDENQVLTRRIFWVTVSGPTAVAIILIEPADQSAEIEPAYRGLVQSAMFVDKYEYAQFAALRSLVINNEKPSSIVEVQSIIESVNGLDLQARNAAIQKLAALFSTAPDYPLDLLLDRRPLIRAAAIDALTISSNRKFDRLLIHAARDPEVFVSDRAARIAATTPNLVPTLRDESFFWINPDVPARVWPYLSQSLRRQILNEGFAEANSRNNSPRVIQADGKIVVAAPGNNGSTTIVVPNEKLRAVDPSGQLSLLLLLRETPVQDFNLPWMQILKTKNDFLTAATLQVASDRHESLPVADLLKLLSSGSVNVRRLAALNLGETASLAEISRLQEFAQSRKSSQPAAQTKIVSVDNGRASEPDSLAAAIGVAIKKIRLRAALPGATGDARDKLLKAALTDPELADWAWSRFVKGDTTAVSSAGANGANQQLQISPFGENAFPEKVSRYLAIPDPAGLFHKLGDSLNSLQLDSARSQASLVLVLNGLHGQLEQHLAAPANRWVFDYSGVKLSQPIATAVWTAEGAPQGVASAQRKAVVLGVTDRYRFERSLALYQKHIGNFASLTDYLSFGARFLGALPAILPVSAEMILSDSPPENKAEQILSYDFGGELQVDGRPVKFFAERGINAQGVITTDTAYLTYIGELALLTPDLDSLHDVLKRLQTTGPVLASNKVFAGAKSSGGDAIYFSNLEELLSNSVSLSGPMISENGALKISNTSWESSYHLTFPESDWSQPLLTFQPDELSAPRDLLPRSTVAYYFMKLDTVSALRQWGKELAAAEQGKGADPKATYNFATQVAPELGPECGIALLTLPKLKSASWDSPILLFCKLKSDKLTQMFAAGSFFTNTVQKDGIARLQLDSTEAFVTVKNGFLLAANSQDVFSLLNQQEKLATSPDFMKAVKRTPAGVVAFGGYNLEATSDAKTLTADSVRKQQAEIILSLTRAFHSPSFYATSGRGTVDAQSSISMDREGRYSVAELQSLTSPAELTFAVLEPSGVPIVNQSRIKSLGIRIHARASGEVERLADDVNSANQTIDARSDHDLRLHVVARRTEPRDKLTLPITGEPFARFLEPTKDIPSDDKTVIDKAREIAGADRDAWSVAKKLSKWTFENLTWKRVDEANAAQTLATREADCYEFSKLYVAMARSLGLPARVVSGLAYSGSAFGGHAWVEVYAGNWIEIDPTWGTDFVDATHVKVSSGALLTYAALNLVQIEITDAPRTVEDYQLDAGKLAARLSTELPAGKTEALELSFDLAVAVDQIMGQGSWSTLSDEERNQLSSQYSRVIYEIQTWLKNSEGGNSLRLLSAKANGDRGSALLMHSVSRDLLVHVDLVQRNGVWLITDMVQTDTGLAVVSDLLTPVIDAIKDHRKGGKQATATQTGLVRVLLTTNRDPQAALQLVDRLLKDDPHNRSLRFAKSLALLNGEKTDEAVKLWNELGEDPEPLPAALFNLAEHYARGDDANPQKAIALYLRYLKLEPGDPRGHSGLADLYSAQQDAAAAETEYRAAIERDPTNSYTYLNLATFYAQNKQLKAAIAAVDEAAKRDPGEDFFGSLIFNFTVDSAVDVAETLAANYPDRMAHSADANVFLAHARIDSGHPAEALPLLRKAASLNQKATEPHDWMAEAYLQLHRWSAAISAANNALKIEPDDAVAYYNRARALARLGRNAEALTSLKKAIELDEEYSELLVDEEDLKSLAALPAFKKLVAEAQKQ